MNSKKDTEERVEQENNWQEFSPSFSPEQEEETGEQIFEEDEEGKAVSKAVKILRVAAIVLGCYLLFAATVVAIVDGRHPVFYTRQEMELETAYGQPYEDPDVYAVLTGRIFPEGKKHMKVTVEGEVDTNRIGDYTIGYYTRFLFREYCVERIVHVRDMTAPVITLKHKDGYQPSWIDGYEEEGYTAIDNLDGDITNRVKRTAEGDGFRYTVKDKAGNETSVIRSPDYAVSRPEITLIGEEQLTIYADLAFTDPGFTAVDSLGNDLSDYVEIEGEVIPYQVGTYQRTYFITNKEGETVSKSRTVSVKPLQNPETISPNGMVLYLTFDDGPGPYTDVLLDVLAAYNVKATFFVTASYPEYFYCIGRAYREGHSIGIHSASHDYYQIYASEDAFFADFNTMQGIIYNQTGSYSNICRFPGGSSNTVSSFNPGIMSRLAEDLLNLGYQYFDWNIASGDAGETEETEQVIENVIEGVSGRSTAIILQHDIKYFSVAAVEKIIIWGLRNGYTFSALNVSSPPAHHKIAN